MEKIWIKKEFYFEKYEFLKFYASFLIFIWFLNWFSMIFFCLNHKKVGNFGLWAPDADVARGPKQRLTWRAGPPRDATRHWGHVVEPGRPAQEAHTDVATW